jgi:hypothetical protein
MVGKAGSPLPPFKNHMIRQRVDRHGNIFVLEPAHELPGCNVPTSEIGVIKEGPVRKWMAAKREWDTKFASAKRRVQKQRAKEMAQGYQTFGNGEVPPPSALAGRRLLDEDLKEEKKKRSTGMSIWALWGSKHDEEAIVLQQEADREPETVAASSLDGAGARPLHDTRTNQGRLMDFHKRSDYSRSRSRRRTVTDQHQTEGQGFDVDENTSAAELLAIKKANGLNIPGESSLNPDFLDQNQVEVEGVPSIVVRTPTVIQVDGNGGNSTVESNLKRPKAGGIAFPFSLKKSSDTASMTTLTSEKDVRPVDDVRTDGTNESGLEAKAETPLKEINGAESAHGKQGELVTTERPLLETFETAPEVPTI